MNNFIDAADPRVKLCWCITAIIGAFALNTIPGLVVLIVIIFSAQLLFTGSLKTFGVLTLALLVVGTQLIMMQLLFCREGVLMWQWGIIKIYSEALPKAILGYLRTSSLAYAAVQFLTWTSSKDAVLMLKAFGLPYRYAMLAGVAAKFFPLMQREYAAITQSQMVRGLDNSSIWGRIKALPPTFFPLLYRAMRRSADTALSMELRGFGLAKERTFTKNLSLKAREKLAIVFLLLIMLFLLLYRLII